MSYLKSLKLTSAVVMRPSDDPVLRTREKIVTQLIEQKAIVGARLRNEEYLVFHNAWRKNEAGEKVQVKVKKRLRQGWFTDASGKVFFALRYAGKAVEFTKDKNAVEVGDLTALPAILDELVEAVRAGELDASLAAAGQARTAILRKNA